MFEQLLEAFVYIMSVYGIMSLISYLARKLWSNMMELPHDGGIRTVLVVKDQEETIEGVIRSYYISRALECKSSEQAGLCNGKNNEDGIVVVDMGSSDKTLEILQRLQSIYGSLEVLSIEEKDKVFEGI